MSRVLAPFFLEIGASDERIMYGNFEAKYRSHLCSSIAGLLLVMLVSVTVAEEMH